MYISRADREQRALAHHRQKLENSSMMPSETDVYPAHLRHLQPLRAVYAHPDDALARMYLDVAAVSSYTRSRNTLA